MANLLKIKRLALGLERKQIAEKVGVTAALVGMWEIEKAWPGPQLIPKLAALFKMAPEDFARELEEARLAAVA